MKRLELHDGSVLHEEDLILLRMSMLEMIEHMEETGDNKRCPQRYNQLKRLVSDDNSGEFRGFLTVDSIVGVQHDPSFQKDLMIVREKLIRDRINPDNWIVSESKASLSYNVTSMVTFDTFKISWCRDGLTPKYNVRTMDGDVEVNAKSVKDAIVNNRLSR